MPCTNVLYVNTLGGVVWLVCTTAGIQIIVVLLAFTVFSFTTKLERSAEQLVAADLSYCWLYPSKQAVDRFVLFAHLDRVLFSRFERSVEQVLTAGLSACASWHWQIIDGEEYE